MVIHEIGLAVKHQGPRPRHPVVGVHRSGIREPTGSGAHTGVGDVERAVHTGLTPGIRHPGHMLVLSVGPVDTPELQAEQQEQLSNPETGL